MVAATAAAADVRARGGRQRLPCGPLANRRPGSRGSSSARRALGRGRSGAGGALSLGRRPPGQGAQATREPTHTVGPIPFRWIRCSHAHHLRSHRIAPVCTKALFVPHKVLPVCPSRSQVHLCESVCATVRERRAALPLCSPPPTGSGAGRCWSASCSN